MPLYVVLTVLISLDAALLALTAAGGWTLDGTEAVQFHFKMGLLASSFTCFIHVLVLFYLIGTGKDVKEAVEDDPELRVRYVLWTQAQKRKVFPPACLAIVLVIAATLMGGEIHSRLLAHDGGDTFPFRELPGWWIHLALVGAAILASAYAFCIEVGTVRENRRGIEQLNAEIAERAGSTV